MDKALDELFRMAGEEEKKLWTEVAARVVNLIVEYYQQATINLLLKLRSFFSRLVIALNIFLLFARNGLLHIFLERGCHG